jgi:hypothetical protein
MALHDILLLNGSNGATLTSFEWRPIRYRNVISIMKNPFCAGVYANAKSEKRTAIRHHSMCGVIASNPRRRFDQIAAKS